MCHEISIEIAKRTSFGLGLFVAGNPDRHQERERERKRERERACVFVCERERENWRGYWKHELRRVLGSIQSWRSGLYGNETWSNSTSFSP